MIHALRLINAIHTLRLRHIINAIKAINMINILCPGCVVCLWQGGWCGFGVDGGKLSPYGLGLVVIVCVVG